MERVGGIIEVKIEGELLRAKGAFTYNLGVPKRESVVGHDTVHGYKELPQPAFIEGAITDSSKTKVKKILAGVGKTVTIRLANKKTVVLKDATFVGEGTGNTEEGEIPVRWESDTAEEFG